MRRIASGEHRDVKLAPDDHVIFSSRVIPGNERAVFAMMNALVAQGVVVKSRLTHPEVHVSSHGYRDELRRFLKTARPRAFVPLHGTRMHLQRHAELAREEGVADVLTLHDGETAWLDRDGLRRAPAVPFGKDALGFGGRLNDEVLRQRRQIGRAGMVMVAVGLDGRCVAAVRGVPQSSEVEAVAERAASEAFAQVGSSEDGLEQVRRAVRRQIAHRLGYKPPVDVRLLSASEEH